MLKALRILIIIAVVASLVEAFDLLAQVIPPADTDSEAMASSYARSAKIHWLVYWPSGLVLLITGILVRRKAALLGNSLAIGGVYLMLLGNNGGLWASGYEIGRLATSIVTLMLLLWIAFRVDKQEAS